MIVRGSLAGTGAGVRCGSSAVSRVPGAATRVVGTPVITDARGRFSYRVPAGPSRTLRFGIRGAGDPKYQCSRLAEISVRARVSLSASRRSVSAGARVRFTGRLRGGYVPVRGKLVELQAFDVGSWRSLPDGAIELEGTFRYSYRFSPAGQRPDVPVPRPRAV